MSADTAAHPDERVAERSAFRKLLRRPELGALVGAIVLFVLFSLTSDVFLTADAQANILYSAATLGVMAVGVSLLMIGGEFDLSTGVAAISSGLVASLFSWYFVTNVWVGVLVALVFSLAIGFLNGFIFVRTKLPSFIVTLAMFFMLAGLNLALTRMIGGSVSSPTISDMDGFTQGKAIFAAQIPIFGVNVSSIVFIWIGMVLVATWVLMRTRVGNWIYACGGDAEAARAVGVPVTAVRIGLFMAVGFCAWVLGMHLLFGFGTMQSGEGIGNEFYYIIAVVVGGCLLTGGYGTAIGGAIGAYIFGMAQRGIVYAGWDADWFRFFLGLMLLAATIINLTVKKRAES